MNKRVFVIIVLISLFTISFVSADTIAPGTKTLDYGIKLSNFDEFPEYTFFLENVGPMSSGITIINSSDILDPIAYKHTTFRFCVAKEKGFDLAKLNFTQFWNNLSEEEQKIIIDETNIHNVSYLLKFNSETARNVKEEMLADISEIYLNTDIAKSKIICFDNHLYHYRLAPIASIIKGRIDILTLKESNGEFDLIQRTQRTFTLLPLLLVLIVFLIEWGIYALILKKDEKPRKLWPSLLLVNFITVILANMLAAGFILIIFSELIIIFIEAATLSSLLKMSYKRILTCSVIANFVTGLLSLVFVFLQYVNFY
jgi:hypothetical protein